MNSAIVVAIPVQAAGNINSSAIPAQNMFSCSVQAVATGSAAGTLKLQASNDNVVTGSGLVPSNWTDISTATVAVSGAGSVLIPKLDICYQWIRAVYSNSGTGTIAANIKVLGM